MQLFLEKIQNLFRLFGCYPIRQRVITNKKVYEKDCFTPPRRKRLE